MSTAASQPLTQRSILWVWLPLAASWAFMTVEYPIIQAAIGHMPDATQMLAAASLVIGLEVAIESPVIMLLATATALVRGPNSLRIVRRFSWHLNLLCTAVAALVAFVDPVFDLLVRDWMSIPTPIADLAQPAMQVMTLWSALIGWRRTNQGILIRAGRSRVVGIGTSLRLLSVAGIAVLLPRLTDLSGVMVGAFAWMTAVLVEGIYSAWAVRSTVATLHDGRAPASDAELTYGETVRFHLPLAGASLLSLMVMPVLQAQISRCPDPVDNLAAWPVLFGVLLWFRSAGLALPEVVIASLDGPAQVQPLRTFCRRVAVGASVGLGLFLLTPLSDLYLVDGLKVPENVLPYVRPGLAAAALVPAIQALQSWYRGLLMTVRSTRAVNVGMAISLTVTSVAAYVAVQIQAPGTLGAALAITVGVTVETLYLASQARGATELLPGASESAISV